MRLPSNDTVVCLRKNRANHSGGCGLYWSHYCHAHSVRGTAITHYKSQLILIALLVEILLSPLADTHPRVGAIFALLTLGLMLSMLRDVAPRWMLGPFLLPAAGLWISARLLEAFQMWPLLSAQVASAVGLALSTSLLWLMLHRFRVLSTSSTSLIAEAVITYLIIAICFSQIYEISDRIIHHAFSHPVPPPRGSTFLCFSMATLTSLGASDLSAINPYVKLLASLESITGIFYLAVVVSRLVSSDKRTQSENARTDF